MSERIDHPPRVREAIDELMCKKDAGGERMSEYITEFYSNTNGSFTALREKIVRCKDCEFAAYDGTECMRVDEWDGSLWFPVEPDGFCAWGERRDA